VILEYLMPDPDVWDAVTVVLRAFYYVASLGAAGLAMFALAFGHRLDGDERRDLVRWTIGAVALAALLSLFAAGVRVQVLSAGNLFDSAVWQAMFRSRIGDAFFIRMAGLGLIALGLVVPSVGAAFAGAGILMVVASYAAMGHSMLYRPRQEIAAIVVVHLACVAFWAGSLLPLAALARRGDRASLEIVADWSKAALVIVPILVASGITGAVLLVQRVDLLWSSWYGNAFLAKSALVGLVLALAAVNKLVLTRRAERGVPGAAAALATAIRVETVLMLIVFYAAAEMVSVHPVDAGHRIPG